MRLVALISGLLLCASGLAQNDSIPWSRLIADPKKSDVEHLLLSNDTSLYMIRSRFTRFMGPEVPFIEKYRVGDFEQTYSKPLVMPVVNGRETKFVTMAELGGNLYLFVRYHHRGDARYRLYAQYITPQGDSKGRPILVDEILLDEGRRTGHFKLAFSDDQQQMALMYYPPLKRQKPQTFTLRLLDKELNTQWQQTLELPYMQETIALGRPVLDNKGNIFVPAEVTNLNRTWTARNPNYYNLVLGCFTKTSQVREFEVKLPSPKEQQQHRSISNLKLQPASNGNTIVAGLYSNLASTRTQSDGVFYLTINPDSARIERTAILDFTQQIKRPFLSDKQLAKNRELEELILTDIVPQDNGAMVLVAEQQYRRQRCTTDPRSGVVNCIDHFYFGDVLALQIEADGKTISGVRIPKSQHSTNDDGPYASVAVSTKGKLPVFYFMDNQKNATGDPSASPRSMQNIYSARLFRVTLNPGKDPEKTLLNSIDNGSVPVPKQQLDFSDGRILIYGAQKKGYRFAVFGGE